jgi:flagellar hook-basal body complex protein FliE
MQSFITQLLGLPINQGDFITKYGEFSDQNEVTKVMAAITAIRNLSEQFGDPTQLIQELANDPTILQSNTAPQEIYSHIVWFATKLNLAAKNYNQTLTYFLQLLQASNDPLQTLKDVLTGPSGLQSVAENMIPLANDLVQALANFNTQLEPSVTNMSQYTNKDSGFLNDVTQDIATDKQSVQTYQDAANDAFKAWRDYTIAATTTSIGVLILSCGIAWPASAILGGVLGDKAAKARAAYDNALDQMHQAEAEEQKKILLYHDLNGLNIQMTPATAASQAFQTTLEQVLGVWTNISTNIAYIANNFTEDQLKDLPQVMQALDLEKATNDWQDIATASEEYTTNSLVTFELQGFGSQLPTPQQSKAA